MSIQEIERAIERLPNDERAALLARLARRHAAEGAAPDEADRRRRLAEAARPCWTGGDGLDYQRRIRAEWDDRPSLGT